jgi:hypothetical protein
MMEPGEAADPHLEALEVGHGVDLVAEPAAHLDAGVAAGKAISPCLA